MAIDYVIACLGSNLLAGVGSQANILETLFKAAMARQSVSHPPPSPITGDKLIFIQLIFQIFQAPHCCLSTVSTRTSGQIEFDDAGTRPGPGQATAAPRSLAATGPGHGPGSAQEIKPRLAGALRGRAGWSLAG